MTARQQVNAAAKRARGPSSDDDEWLRGSEEELELESDEGRQQSDSDQSDSNPFRAGSDSDDGESYGTITTTHSHPVVGLCS